MYRLIYTTKASRGWLRRRALLAETGPILAQDGARIVELQHGFLCHKSASEANRFVQCTCCLCRGFCSSSCADSLQGSHFPDSLSQQSPGISHPTSHGISRRGWGLFFLLGKGAFFFLLKSNLFTSTAFLQHGVVAVSCTPHSRDIPRVFLAGFYVAVCL